MIEFRSEDTAPSCDICDCLGAWEPLIYTWPTGGKGVVKHSYFVLDMVICDKHRVELQPSDFLAPDIWNGIVEWAFKNGQPIPDRITAEVRFRKINHEQVVH